jgi:hypothetical protein
VLDTAACPIPGSYAAEVRAHVRLTTGEEKVFSLTYWKHYDPDRLAGCFEHEGWSLARHWSYGQEPRRRDLYLFRKQPRR